jgi:hypothetical protein
MMKLLGDRRRQTSNPNAKVTLDTDLTVISVAEPKSFGPALVVPKITAKNPARTDSVQLLPRRVARKPPEKAIAAARKRRAQLSRLVEPDVPAFDEMASDITIGERVLCAPGVTLREGTLVKSKPRDRNPGLMTMSQYEEYIKQLKGETEDG